jgi:TonB family protein
VIGAVVRWLPLSLALHTAVVAATLLLPRETTLQPLFVDLTLSPSPVESETAVAARNAAGESPTPARRRHAAPAGRAPAASPPAAPHGAPAAVPAMPSPPPAPQAPAAAPAPAPSPVPAPTAAPAPAPTAPPAAEPAAAPPSPAPPAPTTSAQATGAADAPAAPSAGNVAAGAAGKSGGSGGETTSALPGGSGAGGPSNADVANVSAGGGVGGGGETLALAIPGDDGGAYAGYISLLRRRVQEALTYPPAARRRGLSGAVHLDISVEPSGRISQVLVVRSSSHELLDAAALDAVRTLRQVPFPPGVRPRPVRVRLPVVFELR